MNLPYSYPPFIEKWNEWIEYRREIRKPYKSEKSIQAQLNWFIKEHISPQDAIEIIDTSIRNSWQGLFKQKSHGQSVTKTPSGRNAGTLSYLDSLAARYAPGSGGDNKG